MITFFWKTQHKLVLQYVKVWLQFQWYVKIEQDLIQEHSPRIAQRNKKNSDVTPLRLVLFADFSRFECKVRMVPMHMSCICGQVQAM